MTTTTAEIVARRGSRSRTMAGALALAVLAASTAAGRIQWPSARYRTDPEAFFREILGVEPWDRQVEILNAIRDHSRVAVASGHKVSKSHTAAGAALWFYSSFPGARVVMSSVTSRQVDQILWRELRMMHAGAGRCASCKRADPESKEPCEHSSKIGGTPHELARSGLKADDFREVVGFTAKEAEAVAGISGRHLLYILDEASGIPEPIFEAIEGNRAGGAKVLMISNPTRTEGTFFDAFNSPEKKAFWKAIQISSEETPNVRAGREIIPGLALREWVDEKRAEWGVESPLYKIRVQGQFVLNEAGRILSVHAITAATKLWKTTAAEGRLHLGVDPAGPGEAGDEVVIAARRGRKVTGLYCWRGLAEEAIVAHVLGTLKEARAPKREQAPVVKIDREGPIGSRVYGLLRAHLDDRPGAFELVGVRSSDRACREPQLYDRVRDELWASLAAFLREEGAIPDDTKLAKELHAPSWIGQLNSRLKVTPKKDLRKALGRSPDRADAVALAVWEPSSLRPEASRAPDEDLDVGPFDDDEMDPYGGGLDPYGV